MFDHVQLGRWEESEDSVDYVVRLRERELFQRVAVRGGDVGARNPEDWSVKIVKGGAF